LVPGFGKTTTRPPGTGAASEAIMLLFHGFDGTQARVGDAWQLGEIQQKKQL
jgi:hypothetical protein